MKRNQFIYLSAVMMLVTGCAGPQQKKIETAMPAPEIGIKILDPEALTLLDSTATLEVVGKGFSWTEGPLYISDGDYWLFSDIPPNKIIKWKEGQGVTDYLVPSGYTGTGKLTKEPGSNGLLLTREGELVLCQHGDRRIAKMTAPLNAPRAAFTTLASHYEGKRLNSPNDAVFHSNGDLYFTDPPYGFDQLTDDPGKELEFQGVYRIKPGGQPDLVTRELRFPNGIALSPDGRYLYVASSDPANFVWMQYELDSNGLIKHQRVFYEAHEYEGKEMGAPDGMKITKKGYVFASGPGGIWVFNPAGKLIARIYTGRLTSNCGFTPDERQLLITCDDEIMRLELKP